MEDNDLDHKVMKEVVHFLIMLFPINYVCHFLNAPEQIIRNIEHFDSCEVHEQSNMVCVEFGKSSFTSEVLHDDFHHGRICIKKMAEREESLSLVSIPRLQIWLIIVMI